MATYCHSIYWCPGALQTCHCVNWILHGPLWRAVSTTFAVSIETYQKCKQKYLYENNCALNGSIWHRRVPLFTAYIYITVNYQSWSLIWSNWVVLICKINSHTKVGRFLATKFGGFDISKIILWAYLEMNNHYGTSECVPKAAWVRVYVAQGVINFVKKLFPFGWSIFVRFETNWSNFTIFQETMQIIHVNPLI